jgi:hypothetical protein
MALARFLAFLLLSYVAIALVVLVCVVAALSLCVGLWGLAEWLMVPYWEIIFRKLG